MRGGDVVEEFVDASVDEAPSAVSSVGAWLHDIGVMEFSKCLGHGVGAGFDGGGQLADGGFGSGV